MEKVKLGDICEVFSGFAFKTFNEDKQGKPVIKIGNIQIDGKISLEECSYTKEIPQEKYFSKVNDIYIALSGATTGKVGIMEQGDFLINQRVGVVRLKNNNIPINYLFSFLKSKTVTILQDAFGAAQPNISPKDILNYEIPLPSLEEQKAIAGKLDKVSGLIEKRKTQLEKLDLLIKSRFIEMFGDPIKNSNDRSTTEFINVVKMQRGFDLPVQDRVQNGKIPVFGSNGALDRHNVAKVFGGGVITGRSGTIGRVYYTEGDYWPLNTSLFSVDTHGNNIIYLAHLLQLFDLSRFTEGTGVPTLNRNKFHNQQIIDVPLDEQEDFATFVKQVDKSKFEIQKSLEKLEILKKSLMQQYFG